MTNYELWQAVLAEFELKLTKANFTTWFSHTGIAEMNNGHVILCVPSNFVHGWLTKHYHTDLIKSIERITGKPVKKIDYRVENIKNIKEQECAVPATSGISMATSNIQQTFSSHNNEDDRKYNNQFGKPISSKLLVTPCSNEIQTQRSCM